MSSASLCILVADGVRADTLGRMMDDAALPALARLRAEGGAYDITSTFPSVTGPAYTPFVMGRFAGRAGVPGIRWLDRERRRASFPDYARDYAGTGMRHIDGDVEPGAPTIFELVRGSIAAVSIVSRGVARRDHVGTTYADMLRAARAVYSGNFDRWLAMDRDVGRRLARRVRETLPPLAFAAFLAADKASHLAGQDSAIAREAIAVVDDVAAELRADAERAGRWESTHLWVVSDHGHSPVTGHDDLVEVMRSLRHRTVAHPRPYSARPADVAVMVSGNAMAHLYLDPARRAREWWPALGERWGALVEALVSRESVDLVLLPHSPTRTELRAGGPRRGAAFVTAEPGPGGGTRYSYLPESGDPLGLGAELRALPPDEAYDACAPTDYPDAMVQIAQLAGAPRSGDVILSAARGWDFRASRYERVPHVSSHGALHREHMLVPLLLSRPPARTPRRTADVMPSALELLGVPVPPGLDGASFVGTQSSAPR